MSLCAYRFTCSSLSAAHRHYTNQTAPSVCSLPIYTILHVNKYCCIQRGYRTVSCVVDVDWMKVWVQLVGKGRDGDYRDVQLNRVVIVWMEMNS